MIVNEIYSLSNGIDSTCTTPDYKSTSRFPLALPSFKGLPEISH